MLGLTSDQSARNNVLRPLTQMGLIAEDGTPTPLANAWRNDERYPDVCETIIENLYPEDLTSIHTGSNIDRSRLEGWFQYQGSLGKSASRQSASTYMLLQDKTPKSGDDFLKKPTKPVSKQTRASTPGTRSTASKTKAESSTKVDSTPVPIHTPTWGKKLSLHIDLQIHISPDASPEQIDQIFASMARHLPSIAEGTPSKDG